MIHDSINNHEYSLICIQERLLIPHIHTVFDTSLLLLEYNLDTPNLFQS